MFADPVSTQPVISIHAPLTGSDYQRQRRPKRPTNFNPRSPYGERQLFRRLFLAPSGFQSTLPLRGATDRPDLMDKVSQISIHAPLTGSDRRRAECGNAGAISIHAPLTGSDMDLLRGGSSRNDFNPRSPYGERHNALFAFFGPAVFQSTLPLRGATSILAFDILTEAISIHAPLTGSDCRPNGQAQNGRISIHAPLTGSDRIRLAQEKTRNISIHAPLTGSDSAEPVETVPPTISIHAPLTGSDNQEAAQLLSNSDFNPRSPYGERL